MLQVLKLKEQLEKTVEKLTESREVLKTNENGEEGYFISIIHGLNAAILSTKDNS